MYIHESRRYYYTAALVRYTYIYVYAAAAAGIDLIVIGGSKTKWTTRMTHYKRIYVYIYIHIQTHSKRELKGRKIIIIAKEHITRRGRESKMFDTGTYANHKNNKMGAEVHTTEKGRDFLFFFFLFTVYIKNKTEHLYCMFVYAQSNTLTRGYRVSYLGYANKNRSAKKKKRKN